MSALPTSEQSGTVVVPPQFPTTDQRYWQDQPAQIKVGGTGYPLPPETDGEFDPDKDCLDTTG